MGDLPLWIIVGAFIAWELYAHVIAKNRRSHTLSNRIWALEQRHPKSRAIVLIACVLLAAHLTVQWV